MKGNLISRCLLKIVAIGQNLAVSVQKLALGSGFW
uniref:Uncharacterized protein n=1 Tax=Ciona intestinalis TaxID=7719 RepID=H2XTP9_CIOIN